jgi:UDP-glucose 4-epimerase
VKWWANQNPEQDKKEIQSLMVSLEKVQAKEFVLISSIDVYDQTQNVDENTIPNIDKNHPYGAHRRELEIFIENTFQKTHIVRLPGLFGK